MHPKTTPTSGLKPTNTNVGIDPGLLSTLESRAEHHRASALEFWQILTEIRDKKLYCQTHATFSAYVKARWGFGQSHAYRQLSAAKVARQLSPKGEPIAPKNEAAARVLAAASEAVVSEAVSEAKTDNNGHGVVQVSTAHVKKAARRVAATKEPSPSKTPTPVVDGRGRPVTDPSLATIFTEIDIFKKLINETHGLKRQILDLAGSALGREIREQHVERAIRDIVEALAFARPFVACPMGANCASGCKYCKGSRWIHREYFDALPPELRL